MTGVEGNTGLNLFIDQMAEAMCGWQFRCCTLPEIDAIGHSSFINETECRTSMVAALDERLAAIRFALEEDRLSLDPVAAAACVAEFSSGACAPMAPQPQQDPGASPLWDKFRRCPSPSVGKTPIGAACFLSSECQATSTCQKGYAPSDGEQLTPAGLRASPKMADRLSGVRGQCVPDKKDGEPCAFTRQCAVGLYCRGTDFVCARPAGEGEACLAPLDEKGAPLATVIACGEAPRTLICVANQCHPLPRDGEPCLPATFDTPRCDPTPTLGLGCVGEKFNGDGVCKKAAARGTVCSGSHGLPICAAPFACALSSDELFGTCESAPGVGQPCSFDGRCAPPAVCYAGKPECVLPGNGRRGAFCMSDLDCASLRCLPTPGALKSPTGGGAGSCAQVATPPVCGGPGSFVVPRGNPPPLAPVDGGISNEPIPPPVDSATSDGLEPGVLL